MKDIFSEIAASGIGGRMDLLAENEPEQTEKITSALKKSTEAAIITEKKMSTKEELAKELLKIEQARFLYPRT